METEQLLTHLRDLSESLDSRIVDKDQKAIVCALMRNLSTDVLNDFKYNWLSKGYDFCLSKYAAEILKNQVVKYDNDPVPLLLKLYNDPHSRKKTYARKQLIHRFYYLTVSEQKKILYAFLLGTKTDAKWAMKKALYRWDDDFVEIVERYWNEDNENYIEYTDYTIPLILKYFPQRYIIDNAERLASPYPGSEMPKYYEDVCIAVGNNPEFVIDWDKMNLPTVLYVKATLGIPVNKEDTEKTILKYIWEYVVGRETNEHWLEPLFINSRTLERLIWSMGKLGMYEALFRLYDFLMKAKTDVAAFDYPGLISAMRKEFENNIEEL